MSKKKEQKALVSRAVEALEKSFQVESAEQSELLREAERCVANAIEIKHDDELLLVHEMLLLVQKQSDLAVRRRKWCLDALKSWLGGKIDWNSILDTGIKLYYILRDWI